MPDPSQASPSRAPDGPGDAAGPDHAPPDTVGILDLARAIGTKRSSILRALAKRKIPAADRPTLGGHRRWSVTLAAEIVRGRGLEVPAAWGAAAAGLGQP